jgi:hypothetical protein
VALVTRRYRFVGPPNTDLSKFVGNNAARNATFYPGVTIDVDVDNNASGIANLDDWMAMVGWVYDATTVPGAFAAGTVGAPGISLSGDPNTGLYSVGADQLGVAAGGVLASVFTTQGHGIPAGLIGTPGLFFNGDPDTGMFSSVADNWSAVAGGVRAMRFTNQGAGMAVGAVGTPGLFVEGDTNTGFYQTAADELALALGGVQAIHYAGANAAMNFKKAVRSEPYTLTYGASITPDLSLSNLFVVTLTGALATLANPTNMQNGQSFSILIYQDGTGGRALNYGTAYAFGSEGAPVLTSSGAGICDIISGIVLQGATKIACTTLRGFVP